MSKPLRIAYFADSFDEVNGVATTSKRLLDFVEQWDYPFLFIHTGKETKHTKTNNLEFLSLKHSPFAIPMDVGLKYDPLFFRHARFVEKQLEEFKPDVIHITGLNDVSNLGAFLSWRLGIAMIASWHTNLHEYAALRLKNAFKFLPQSILQPATGFLEQKILDGALLYYKMPQKFLAPNADILQTIEKGTGRDGALMIRGVDTTIFSPKHRTVDDGVIRFGFVGRLRAEKNVRMLVNIERRLLAAGRTNFKFLVVGEGSEREFLAKNMKTVELPDFLDGRHLSEAYANMDVFLFPSETDTFGNVVQEANASGVPAIVTDKGGPKFIIREGETGFIAKNLDDFVNHSLDLIDNPKKLTAMKKAAVEFATYRSWDSVFEKVYEAYKDTKRFRDAKITFQK